jgi:hypothetical protein
LLKGSGMKRIILGAAFVALTSGVAMAGLQKNGPQFNGIQLNGIQLNGIQLNGIQLNGIQLNGIQLNGIQLNGIQLNGSNLSGSFLGVSSTCAHREDVTGTALPASCSPCAQVVIAADPYCTNNSWDSLCVSGAKSHCTLDKAELKGTEVKATLDDGSWAKVRIDNVTPGLSAQHNGTQYLNMTDTYYYTMSYTCSHAATVTGAPLALGCSSTVDTVCAADSYCCTSSWDGTCVAEANGLWQGYGTAASIATANKQAKGAGGNVCGTTSTGRGVFVPGRWNMTTGAKTSTSKTDPTFACEGIGAIAKCVNMGYKPWISSSHDKRHRSCVRMVRGDYCGTGVSYTSDGRQIDVEDGYGIQMKMPSSYKWDADWSENGVVAAGEYYRSGASAFSCPIQAVIWMGPPPSLSGYDYVRDYLP